MGFIDWIVNTPATATAASTPAYETGARSCLAEETLQPLERDAPQRALEQLLALAAMHRAQQIVEIARGRLLVALQPQQGA